MKERRDVQPGPRVEGAVRHQKSERIVGLELLVIGPVRSEGHLTERRDGLDLDPRPAEACPVVGRACLLRAWLEHGVGDLHEPGQALGDLDPAGSVRRW